MQRLTTDNPHNNFETMMNMVYSKDGWQYIRHGEEGMPTVDFCLMLCKERGCQMPDYDGMTNEAKDEMLCDCTFEGCPVATIYAALSGFGHVRGRLKMYEDADMIPRSKEVYMLGDAIKTGSNTEFDVVYDDGTCYHVAEGILFEAKGEDMYFHLGTNRAEVLFSVAEALVEVVKRTGLEDDFTSYIERCAEGQGNV